MDNTVTLSSNEFKALASETRTEIIKLLQQRNHTLSELSKKLEMTAPTIKQHLAILQSAELVQDLDEGRKWKYYTLTRKGKNIFAAETPVNIMIVLSLTVIALAGMLYLFVSMLGVPVAMQSGFEDNLAKIAPMATEAPETVAGQVTESSGVVAGQTTVRAASVLSTETIALLVAIVAVALLTGFLLGKLKG